MLSEFDEEQNKFVKMQQRRQGKLHDSSLFEFEAHSTM